MLFANARRTESLLPLLALVAGFTVATGALVREYTTVVSAKTAASAQRFKLAQGHPHACPALGCG